MIANHHGHLDVCAGNPELVENSLVCRDDVGQSVDSAHEREFPEAESIADDQQLGCRGFPFLTPSGIR